MLLPFSKRLGRGAAVALSAVLIGAVAFAYAPVMKSRASVSEAKPGKFPGVRVQVSPAKDKVSKTAPSPLAAGAEIHIDQDGKRIIPGPSDVAPAEHPELRSVGKSGLTYKEHDLPGGLKKIVPSSPIRTLSVLEIDKDGKKKLDCLSLPESAIEGLAVQGVREGAAK